MNSNLIEFSGKNVEEATKNALRELNVSEEMLEVQVIEPGSKGLFNFIGAKQAKIQVMVKRNSIYEAEQYLKEVLQAMNILAEISIIDEDDTLKINLSGKNMGILIGYRGETLDALQYLVGLVVNKGKEEKYKRVIIDTENYRAKREETLKRLALKVASKVKTSGRVFKIEPMNPYERRIIHATLQSDPYINTYSEGDEPFRRVVVDLKKA